VYNDADMDTLANQEVKSIIAENIARLNSKIEASCHKAGRSAQEITLVTVTKTVPAEIIELGIQAGIKIIGENRVQEAQEKFKTIGNKVEWHLIGHLQTNKAKKAVEIFSMIQSIDSLHLAQEVDKRLKAINKVMPVLIEVNTSGEDTKFGIGPAQLFDLIKDMIKLPNLKIDGLMTIGPGLAVEDKEKSRPCFRMLYELREKARKEFNLPLPYLSMGMSSDFEIGIEQGSNMIRIGTAIFGQR
jgi:pyridoxal phosphate enzyme (YggS family)